MPSSVASSGTLLDGRVIYNQPAQGYRTGIEPVLLAASVAARPGDRVVEAGTGAGAGLLALAARVSGLTGIGLERDPSVAAVAAANLAANNLHGLRIAAQDVILWRAEPCYHHAFANPPWHDESGTCSPDPGRRAAKFAGSGLLGSWSAALARSLVHRGTLTFILPASSVTAGMAAMTQAGVREIVLLPIWPRQGHPARLIVLSGRRNGRGPARVLPGLVLHLDDGAYTAEADLVLRSGAGLPLWAQLSNGAGRQSGQSRPL